MENQLAKISELKGKVIAAGYHQNQVNDIIREVAENLDLKKITYEQSCELIESLQFYCDFAEKCKKGNCRK
ncbi:hypothetical protein [Pelosinus sp. UFO1]|uniref:hypothetical protein n=1 Tax=Pelosinus sp. UFO1 TaxID=484770 RepID=UPI0004D1741A|nr:hypothetical protein [Pelosinus sp. UFO1]AIF53709.1 hypothetical protein UFO1_4166 [Pelosinus sp. UFO1]